MTLDEIRFLVVEDHGLQRWAIDNMLRGLGARHILVAANPKTALDLHERARDPVDILVWNLDMPGADAMEFIRRLSGDRPPPAVIFLSSLERSLVAPFESMARAGGIVVLGTIEKPLASDRFAAVIRAYVPHPGRANYTARG